VIVGDSGPGFCPEQGIRASERGVEVAHACAPVVDCSWLACRAVGWGTVQRLLKRPGMAAPARRRIWMIMAGGLARRASLRR